MRNVLPRVKRGAQRPINIKYHYRSLPSLGRALFAHFPKLFLINYIDNRAFVLANLYADPLPLRDSRERSTGT